MIKLKKGILYRWIYAVTQENWINVKQNNIWATSYEKRTKKMTKDDYVIFYVKGTGYFRGIFKVVSDWYKTTKPVWADEIAENKVKYPYQCKLEPVLIGDAVYNELVPNLSFVKNKSNPSSYLQSHQVGPSNHSQPIDEKDFDLIKSKMSEPIEIVENNEEKDFTAHEDIITKLIEIGPALGFESYSDDEHISVAKGSKVDLIWQTKIANVGLIQYVFEVQSKGSIKSLINNLIQAMNSQQVKKVIAVSDNKQLGQIKDHITQMKAITDHSKSMFVFMDFDTVNKVHAALPVLNDFKTLFQSS